LDEHGSTWLSCTCARTAGRKRIKILSAVKTLCPSQTRLGLAPSPDTVLVTRAGAAPLDAAQHSPAHPAHAGGDTEQLTSLQQHPPWVWVSVRV